MLTRFIIDGVPRSGTTALATAISMHKNTFCAAERYQVFADHARCLRPETLEDAAVPPAFPDEGGILRENSDVLAHREREIIAFGNKTPRYYFNVLDILEKNRDVLYLPIVRDPLEVASSWNVRAGNQQDAWNAQDTGLGAIFEFLQICYILANVDPARTLVVSYDEIFFDGWRTAVGKLYRRLRTPVYRSFMDDYKENLVRPSKRSPSSAREHEEEFYRTVGLAEISTLLRQRGTQPLAELPTELFGRLDTLFADLDTVVRTYLNCAAGYKGDDGALHRIFTDQSYFFARARHQSFLDPLKVRPEWPHFNLWVSLILFYRTAFAAARMVYRMAQPYAFASAVETAFHKCTVDFDYIFCGLAERGFDRLFEEAFRSNSPEMLLGAADRLEEGGLIEDAQLLRLRAVKATGDSHYHLAAASAALGRGEDKVEAVLEIGMGTTGSYVDMSRLWTGFR